MKIGNLHLTVSDRVVFITGQWTVPIAIEEAKKIFIGPFAHSPNDGLCTISPAIDKTCLSVSPTNAVKLALTENELKQLIAVLGKF